MEIPRPEPVGLKGEKPHKKGERVVRLYKMAAWSHSDGRYTATSGGPGSDRVQTFFRSSRLPTVKFPGLGVWCMKFILYRGSASLRKGGFLWQSCGWRHSVEHQSRETSNVERLSAEGRPRLFPPFLDRLFC